MSKSDFSLFHWALVDEVCLTHEGLMIGVQCQLVISLVKLMFFYSRQFKSFAVHFEFVAFIIYHTCQKVLIINRQIGTKCVTIFSIVIAAVSSHPIITSKITRYGIKMYPVFAQLYLRKWHYICSEILLPPATNLREGNVLHLSKILFTGRGSLSRGELCQGDPRPHVTVRAVRILLECILVQ